MTSKVFTSRGIPESIGEAIEQVAVAFGEVGNYAKVSCVYPILECRHNIIKSAAGRQLRSSSTSRQRTLVPYGTIQKWVIRPLIC
jgi:hypothetical protein